MFGTVNNPKNNPPLKLESVLGPDTEVHGPIHCRGSLRIDGRVEGSVSAQAVTIGENALVQGDIRAKSVVVGGKVKGNITAETIEIKLRSQITGDLKTRHISIAEGAVFDGNCSMTLPSSSPIDLEHLSAEKADELAL